MPFTQTQASDSYILGALGLFLDRNVKTAHDAAVGTALSILMGKPDDISIVRRAPSIAVDFMSSKANTEYGVGQNIIWRHRNILFSCFPALDSNGAPSQANLSVLRSLMSNAFSTVSIKVPDYSNVSYSPTARIWCSDVLTIDSAGQPVQRSTTSTLAEEKHRFDMHVSVCYAVQASTAT